MRYPNQVAVSARPRELPAVVRDAAAPKILLYSHDTFGLGNIRRTLVLSETLADLYPRASILIVTGSPMIHAFRLPARVDYIKLPCLDRVEADRYAPMYLEDCSAEVRRTRAAVLEQAVLGFGPDLMVVDKRPGGVDGELVRTLEALERRGARTKVVLGMRDILDEPDRTSAALRRSGGFELVDRFYDEVWIYGTRDVFDAVTAYEFPESVARKTRFCGYLKRPTHDAPRPEGPPRVLVTTGGGGDGDRMIETYLEGLGRLPRSTALRSTVLFGPQMPASRRAALVERYGYLSDVTLLDFDPDLTRRYAEADVVVSMAGYNTVCEMLSFARRAVLVPRAEPVREQLIRARLLAARGLFEVVEPDELTPETLISKVLALAEPAPPRAIPLDLEGLPRVRERVRDLLAEARS